MKIEDYLIQGKKLFLDTAPVIYYNDIQLKRVTELPILVLSDFITEKQN
jgi:hypothetical protein